MCSCVFKSCAIVSRAHASSCFGFHGVMCSCHVGSHNVSCMCSRHECSLISCVHDIAGSRVCCQRAQTLDPRPVSVKQTK